MIALGSLCGPFCAYVLGAMRSLGGELRDEPTREGSLTRSLLQAELRHQLSLKGGAVSHPPADEQQGPEKPAEKSPEKTSEKDFHLLHSLLPNSRPRHLEPSLSKLRRTRQRSPKEVTEVETIPEENPREAS